MECDMTVWPFDRTALGLFLLLSLSLKSLDFLRPDLAKAVDHKERIIEFLDKQGFKSEVPTSDIDLFSIAAESGDCQLLVAELSPQGWHSDVIRKLIPQGSRLMVFYKGAVYDNQPVLLTRFDDYLGRMLHTTRLGSGSPPVIGIVASPECVVDKTSWLEFTSSLAM
jgi:hypothetical protein